MSAREMFQQPEIRRRSPLAALLSLLVHAALSVAITGLAYMQITRPAIKREQTLTFLRVSMPTAPVDVIEPLRETPPLEVPAPEPPAPEAIVELPKPPAPEPEPVVPKPVEPVAPKRPEVKVGEFAAAPAPSRKADPRQVQTVGFEMQQAVAPDLKMKITEVGSFEARDTKDARLGSDRPAAAVTPSGFESSQALTGGRRTPAVVASGGFGSTATAPKPAAREAVKPVGFADAQPATTTAQRPQAERTVTPVEITFKPMPAYSDEARALKIQGEVTLEVEFSAGGQVRVRRVVRGLGHGLDEMATRAAEQIRFKPAQSGGTPVDFTATVQIVFRLS